MLSGYEIHLIRQSKLELLYLFQHLTGRGAKSTGIEFTYCLGYQVQLSSQLNELCKAEYSNQRMRNGSPILQIIFMPSAARPSQLFLQQTRDSGENQHGPLPLSHLSPLCCFLHFKFLFCVKACMYSFMCVHICQWRPEVSCPCIPFSLAFHLFFLKHIS